MAARAGYRQRKVIQALAVAALAALLLFALVPAALAAKAPPLAATAQYKAFVDYVKKLDGIAGQARSQAQKDKYEAELTAKRTAAAHKASALFKRASEEAKAEYDAKYKEQAEIVRQVEADELEAVAAEFDGKIDRATGSYQLKLTQVDQGRQTFEARVREQIEGLRAQKARTADIAQKTAIQERISALIEQIAAKRGEATQKRADLKAGFREQKQQIEAARVTRARPRSRRQPRRRSRRSPSTGKKRRRTRKRPLNSKRESQLGYIEAKLEKGRADIASMPTVG